MDQSFFFRKEAWCTPRTIHKILLFPYWKSLDRMLRRTSQTTDTIICISCSLNLLLNGTKKLFLWDRRILLKLWCCFFLHRKERIILWQTCQTALMILFVYLMLLLLWYVPLCWLAIVISNGLKIWYQAHWNNRKREYLLD